MHFIPRRGGFHTKLGTCTARRSDSLSRNCSSFPHFESRRILEITQPVILENLTARDKLDSAVACWNPGGERHKADFSEQRARAPRAVVFQKAPWRPLSTTVGLSKPSSVDSESGSAHPLNDDWSVFSKSNVSSPLSPGKQLLHKHNVLKSCIKGKS